MYPVWLNLGISGFTPHLWLADTKRYQKYTTNEGEKPIAKKNINIYRIEVYI